MKITIKSLVFTFLLFAANADTNEIENFQVKRSDGSLIDYYIRKNSRTNISNTLLLVLQGSSCNSVAQIKSIDDVAVVWPDTNILLIEKYGITSTLTYSKGGERKDCPSEYLKMDSLDQRVSDVLQVIKNIQAMDSYENYLMLGGSEGAAIANIVASK